MRSSLQLISNVLFVGELLISPVENLFLLHAQCKYHIGEHIGDLYIVRISF